MNFTKSILTFGIASALIFSCKDTANKPVTSTEKNNTIKEISIATKPETASFKIEGMTCAMGCAKTIETKLSKLDGVQKAIVDFDNKQATVDFDAAVLTKEELTKTVEATGDGETYKVSGMQTKGKVKS
ncbi:MAG: heavy-metal-associated domain-containing protein [Flavobacteriaceae bacterium]|nr:heavy-metal-associated domain-containing protein [Flavobacteriaceae bacterium]